MSHTISVIVTSAVNATFSIYNPEQRMSQTLHTIESIRDNIPGAEITLLEVSVPGLSAEQESRLTSQVKNYVSLSEDENIVFLQNNLDRKDVVKNMTEAMALRRLCDVAMENKWFADSKRVMKISGRYWLTKNFDLSLHLNPLCRDKFVFRKKNLSQFRPIHTETPLQYQTRLYSFHPDLLPRYAECLEKMVEEQQLFYNTNRYMDIEHQWWRLLKENEVIEADKIGVTGYIAPNGQEVDD